MEESESPPEIQTSASDQKLATRVEMEALTKLPSPGGIVGHSSTAEALSVLGVSGIRGGGMVLLEVIIRRLEEDLHREREGHEATKAQVDSWKGKYFSEREDAAVLRERIDALTRIKILQNVFLSAGGLFLGLGTKMIGANTGVGATFCLAGSIFLFAGWLWPKGFKTKEQSQ